MAMAALRLGARRLARPRPPPPPALHSRAAAVAEEPRRLLPLPRHIHGGNSSSPAGPRRAFSLAEQQRRLWPSRLSFHGGPTAAARICSRRFCSSSKRGEPNPVTWKDIMMLFSQTLGLLCAFSSILMELTLIGLGIALLIRDLSGPRYVPLIARIMLGPVEDIDKLRGPRVLKDGKWVSPSPNGDE